MRIILTAALSLFSLAAAFAVKPADGPNTTTSKPKTIRVPNGPTIRDLRDFPIASLRASINPKLYNSLSISPVEAWVIAQTPRFPGDAPKVIRSDAGGAYDKFALELAKQWSMINYDTTESRTHRPVLSVHLLIYKIADGLMAVNFSHNDEAFYAGFQRSDVWVGVWKDGKWTTVGGTKHTRQTPSPYG